MLYYQTISECPLTVWEKRFKKGNSAIRKDVEGFNYTDDTDYDAWDVLYIDWQNNVKQDPDYVQYQKDIAYLNRLMIQYLDSEKNREGITVRDNSLLNMIQRVRGIIEKYEKNLGQGKSINQTIQILSKSQGYQIPKRELTVQDYFDLIELHSEKNTSNG